MSLQLTRYGIVWGESLQGKVPFARRDTFQGKVPFARRAGILYKLSKSTSIAKDG
jgi:hypothetical protein